MAKNNKYYKQCLIIQPLYVDINESISQMDSGYSFDVVWLPEKFAKKEKIIRIDKRAGLWKVKEVWGRKNEEWLISHERDFKNQRKASDI